MPRNVSGTYSLPLPPVVPNTVIQAAWANTTTDDIAQGITDSLDRNGRGGMIAPFRLVDGSVLQPAFAFASETGTGLYKVSPGIMGVSVMGVKVAQWSGASYDVLTDFGVAGDLSVNGNISFTGGVVVTGDTALDGNLGVTGGILVDGGITSLDDISINETFDGLAGLYVTNNSPGVAALSGMTARNNASKQILMASTGTGYTGVAAASNTALFYSDTAQGMFFVAGGGGATMIRFSGGGTTEQMRLTAGGSLGIGGYAAGAPWEKLNLYDGNFAVTNAFPGAGVTPSPRYIFINAQNSFGGTPVGGAGLGVFFTRVSGDTDYGSDLLFFTAADNVSVERMRVDLSGNVGIGTAGGAIGSTLHVKRSTSSVILVEAASSGAAGLTLKANTAAGNSTQVLFQSSAASLYALGAGSIGSIGVNDFGLYSYLKARNIFNVTGADGFVGINENAPGTMLSVNSAASGVAGLRVAVAGASNQGQIILGNNVMQGGDDYVGFNWIRSVTTLMHLDGNTGNLSIGMGGASGAVRVHAKAAGAGARVRVESSDPGGAYGDFTADGSSAIQIGSNSGHPFYIYVNSGQKLYIGVGAGAPMLWRANLVDYINTIEPGTDGSASGASIPIGGIVAGTAVGVSWAAVPFFGTCTMSATLTLTVAGYASSFSIQTGTYRLIGRFGASDSVVMQRIA